MSRILRFEPASQPQNLQAEPEQLERVSNLLTKNSSFTKAVANSLGCGGVRLNLRGAYKTTFTTR